MKSRGWKRMAMARRRRLARRGFSLIEVVMVVTIIGMISSMAIPRLSRGTTAASGAALAGDLAVIRRAINFYAVEHGGVFPGPTSGRFVAQMTQYSDAAGNSSPTRSVTHTLGPYVLRIPPCPIGENAGDSRVLIDATHSPPTANPSTGHGWIYNPTTGEFYANTGTQFQAGVKLDSGSWAIDIGLN